jgi:hypothetical protein
MAGNQWDKTEILEGHLIENVDHCSILWSQKTFDLIEKILKT